MLLHRTHLRLLGLAAPWGLVRGAITAPRHAAYVRIARGEPARRAWNADDRHLFVEDAARLGSPGPRWVALLPTGLTPWLAPREVTAGLSVRRLDPTHVLVVRPADQPFSDQPVRLGARGKADG
jgi:hypothetical protein